MSKKDPAEKVVQPVDGRIRVPRREALVAPTLDQIAVDLVQKQIVKLLEPAKHASLAVWSL